MPPVGVEPSTSCVNGEPLSLSTGPSAPLIRVFSEVEKPLSCSDLAALTTLKPPNQEIKKDISTAGMARSDSSS